MLESKQNDILVQVPPNMSPLSARVSRFRNWLAGLKFKFFRLTWFSPRSNVAQNFDSRPNVCVKVCDCEFMRSGCSACAHELYLFTQVSVCKCVLAEGGRAAEGFLPWGFYSGPLINPLSGRRVSVIRLLQSSWLCPNSTIPKAQVHTHWHKHTHLYFCTCEDTRNFPGHKLILKE